MSQNEQGRRPINDKPMTAAERKRRSREAKKEGKSLKSTTAEVVKEFAGTTGYSDRMARYIMDIHNYGVPEWYNYYGRHDKDKEYLSFRKAAIAARRLNENEQRTLLKTIEEHGYRFTNALYSELWNTAGTGSTAGAGSIRDIDIE